MCENVEEEAKEKEKKKRKKKKKKKKEHECFKLYQISNHLFFFFHFFLLYIILTDIKEKIGYPTRTNRRCKV